MKVVCNINREEIDVTSIYNIYIKLKNENHNKGKITEELLQEIYNVTELSHEATNEFYCAIIEQNGIPKTFFGETKFKENLREGRNSFPKCPTCNSTDIQKISTVKRTGIILGLGILSKNIGKTFECKNCGYKW